MKRKLVISNPTRPHIPEYGITEGEEGLLNWKTVDKWLSEEKNYWVSTTKPNSKPHSRPVWGIWLENFLYFGGGNKTKTYRNLLEIPNVSVHTQSGENVVIIEGYVEIVDDEDLNKVLGSAYELKYEIFHPPPFWKVIPQTVFCWDMSEYEKTPTKFVCKLE